MPDIIKKSRKEIAEERREQFLQATCKIIDRQGLADTSLQQIAGEIGISAGLVAHYFGDKKNLLYATMLKMMRDLKKTIADLDQKNKDNNPVCRIRSIIDGNFHNSQDNRAIIKTWLNFWVASLYDEKLRRLQRINEYVLFSTLYRNFSALTSQQQAENSARSLAAMIDGFWLHLALSQQFSYDEARKLTHQYLDQFLALHAPDFLKSNIIKDKR